MSHLSDVQKIAIMLARQRAVRFLSALAFLTPVAAIGQTYDLSWRTIDAGGDMWTTGGDFELSGTIGQPDASTTVMAGGDFELIGGFWPGATVFQLGDLNCDGAVNAFDIDPFVELLTGD